MPKFAIANGYAVGMAPQCLLELEEVELAFIAPKRTHGQIFTFFGGDTGIRGFHSFFSSDLTKVKQVVGTLHDMSYLANVVLNG